MPPAPLLGQASIVIDQVTLGPGAPGRSRNDGVLGQVVTARNADNTNVLKHLWVLARPRGSTAVLSSPKSATCQFTPDHDGSYALVLYVNEGTGKLQKQVRIFAVKSGAGQRYPAQGETNEANWLSEYTGVANETGYWEDLIDILRSVSVSVDGTLLTVDAEAGLPTSRQLAVGQGLDLTDNGAGDTLVLSTLTLNGVQALLDVDGLPENLLAVRANFTPTRRDDRTGQTNLGSESFPGFGTQGYFATIGGGLDNLASGNYSVIPGGYGNSATGAYSIVSGGNTNAASGDYAVIIGGHLNSASENNSSVLGGSDNAALGSDSCVAGGGSNSTGDEYAAVVGGYQNQAVGRRSFVAAGSGNLASAESCVVLGDTNSATADYGVAIGRSNTVIGTYGVAIGRSGSVSNDGAAVLKDGSATSVQSTVDNELTAYYSGGMRLLYPDAKLMCSGFPSTSNWADRVQNQLTTTNATPTTATLTRVPGEQDCTIRGVLKGKRNGTSDQRALHFWATYNHDAGVVTMVGSAVTNSTQTTGVGNTWSAGISISGDTLLVSITGAAAQTIRWTWDFEVSIGGAS